MLGLRFEPISHMDLAMLQLFNSHQRDEEQWTDLFHRADPGFKFHGYHRLPGAAQSIIVVSWEGQAI